MFVLQQVTIVVFSGHDYKDFLKKMTDLGSINATQPMYGMQRRTMSQTSALVPPPVRQTSASAQSSGRQRRSYEKASPRRGWISLVIYFILFNWLVFLC